MVIRQARHKFFISLTIKRYLILKNTKWDNKKTSRTTWSVCMEIFREIRVTCVPNHLARAWESRMLRARTFLSFQKDQTAMQLSLNDLKEPFHDNFSSANAIIIKRKWYTRWFSKVEWDIKLLEETPDNFIIFDTPKGLKTHFYRKNLKSFKINASWNFSYKMTSL